MATAMEMFRALLFLVLFIGTYCENPSCRPTVRDESFTQFMESRNCEVDEKLLNLFTDELLFKKSILGNPYGNIMCIGLMDVLALAPETLCDSFDHLGEIPDTDFCSSPEMEAALRKIIDGGTFDDDSNIVKVSNFTKEYCKTVCNDTNQLCWAFGRIARAVLKHTSVSTTTPKTNPSTTAPTTQPTRIPIPDLESNADKDNAPGNVGNSKSEVGVVQPTGQGDKRIDSNNATARDETLTSTTEVSIDGFFDDKQKGNSSVKEAELEHVSKDEDSMNTDTTGQEVQKNSTKAVTNQEDQDPSEAPSNLQVDGTNHSNDTVVPISSSGKVDDVNQTVTNATEDITIQPDDVTSQPSGTDDYTNTDNNYNVNADSTPLGDSNMKTEDSTTDQPLDSSEQNSNQGGADFNSTIGDDDGDDDGYSYWHFAAILLFILFLGVAGYLASLNRKKIRESVSTYMSKRKRKREYKPVNTMEAGLS